MTQQQLITLIGLVKQHESISDEIVDRLDSATEAVMGNSLVDASIELRGAMHDYVIATGASDLIIDLANIYAALMTMEAFDE